MVRRGSKVNMAVEMAKPLDKIKRIRSLGEVLTRGGQALSAYREQRLGAGQLPSDDEFVRLIDSSQFGKAPIIAESLWQRFFKNGDTRFFRSFKGSEGSIATFKARFGERASKHFIDSAENIVGGRIDLIGLKNLYVGTDIDWHREPLSAKSSPLQHWKQFDDLDTSETGNKKIVWELNRHQHFFTLGVAFWLTGDERFGETFARQLESWMEQNPPGLGINWASSLEVSFRAMSWIWAFHFFRNSDHFTPDLFRRALKHLYRHGRHIERYLSTYYSPNTHLTGEALGLYYLGTQLPFFERSKQWRKLGAEILSTEIDKQILPDGVYFEQSTWYQRYTVDMFAHFVMLRSLYDQPPENMPADGLETRLQRAFDFLRQITLPDGTTPIIGDDDGGRVLPLTAAAADDFRGSLGLGALIFDRSDYKSVAGGAGEEVFWLAGTKGLRRYDAIKAAEPAAATMDFPDGGYSVMRDGWSDTDNFLIVDCGEVGSLSGGHGHADALSIEVAVHGRTLLVDSGTYTYHESPELRDYFRSSTAHNTVAVDDVSSSQPGNIFGWKTRAAATRKTWIAEDRFDHFEGSHDGYERLSDPAIHNRSILFLKNDYWIMRDLVTTTGAHDFAVNFHYHVDARPEIGDGGRWVGDDDHRLFTFGDNGVWQRKESWISTNHGNKTNAPFLRFVSSGEGPQEFFTFILPVDRGAGPPEVSEVPLPAGRAFIIKYRGYTDVLVFNDDRGHSIDNGLFQSNFAYSWARLSEGQAVPDEFVLIDGSDLIIMGNEILKGPEVKFAALRRLGNDLYIKTDRRRKRAKIAVVEKRKRERRQSGSDRRRWPRK